MEALSFVNIQWVKPLAEMLKKIRGERAKQVEALQDEFGNFQPLLDYYVVPYCQHHNPADYNEDAGSRSNVKAPVYDTLQEFLGGETIERDGSNQMFVLADAGMGKTSLLLMLKLWHLFSFWPKGYDCLLLKLGESSLERIKNQPGKANTVLLLDALDEDPLARGRIEERLRELLQASRNFRQVLITCRTQFFPATGLNPFGNPGQVTVEGCRCQQIFLSLFTDAQVEEYLQKRFPDPWHSFFSRRADPRRSKAKATLGSMKSLRFRPLLLAYVDELLKAEGHLADAYQVFQALVRVWLLREIKKMKDQRLEAIPNEQELWAACRLLAVYLQTLGQRELTEEELGELMRRLPAVSQLERLNFGGRSLLNRNSSRDYRFSHYSIQEFLAANAVCEGVLQDDLDLCPEPARGKRMKLTAQMLDFMLAGKRGDKLQQGSESLDWQDLTISRLLAMVDKKEIAWGILHNMGLRSKLRIGETGPEMVIAPAGVFFMGSKTEDRNAQEYEFPRHRVVIPRPFAIGRYPITFDDYDRYCEATGKKKANDRGWGRGSRPIINVSWEDAQDYCSWLSEQTGQNYRLPSEAEWEYAARAGTDTAYWWGDEIGVNHCNCRDSGSQWSGQQTSPVGSFAANSFGLYDTQGNVWEWVQDRWHRNYEGAPEDGSAWESGEGVSRVRRGGSWDLNSDFARCAIRYWDLPDFRLNFLGFRVVCGVLPGGS